MRASRLVLIDSVSFSSSISHAAMYAFISTTSSADPLVDCNFS